MDTSTNVVRAVYKRFYEKARAPEDLDWHRLEVPRLLERAVSYRTPARALDVGSGTGVFSSWLAQRGWSVTALDFIEKAVEMTRQRAKDSGVSVDAVHGDALSWTAPHPFELVFDSGCLHSFGARAVRERYREQLLRWLAQDGDYVLHHFAPLFPLDWRPIGPRRRDRGDILALFCPELCEMEHDDEIIDAGFPVGPKAKVGSYWFRRNRARSELVAPGSAAQA